MKIEKSSPVTSIKEQATGQAPVLHGGGKEFTFDIKMGLCVLFTTAVGFIAGLCLNRMYYSKKYNELEGRCFDLEHQIKDIKKE